MKSITVAVALIAKGSRTYTPGVRIFGCHLRIVPMSMSSFYLQSYWRVLINLASEIMKMVQRVF